MMVYIRDLIPGILCTFVTIQCIIVMRFQRVSPSIRLSLPIFKRNLYTLLRPDDLNRALNNDLTRKRDVFVRVLNVFTLNYKLHHVGII